MPDRLRRALPVLVALLLSAGLAVERLDRVAADPGGVLVGGWAHPDCLGNHWLMVWVAERLAAGQDLLHNDAYYAPFGDAPWLAGNGSEGVLYLPFHLALGWPTGAGVFLLAVLTWNGVAGYLLGRAAGAGPWGALVGAAATGSMVYVVSEVGMGRFTQADVGWTCAALAGLIATLDAPTRARAALTGAALAAAAALYWYHGVFLVLAAAALVVGRLGTRRGVPWAHLVGAGALSLLLVAPLIVVYARHWAEIPGTGEAVFPHPEALRDALHPIWPLGVRGGRHPGQAVAAPVAALALLALGRWLARRSERPGLDLGLLVLAVVALLLAMGPDGPLYTPLYGLAEPLRRFWWPSRHLLLEQLALAALAARGTAALLPRLGRFGPAVAVALALSVSPALRALGEPVRAHQSPAVLPEPFYVGVGALPGEVLLQVPFTAKLSGAQTPLIQQLAHRKRLVNGHSPWVARVRPPAWDARVRDNSFLAALAAYERGDVPAEGLSFEAADLRALIDEGLAVVVVDRSLLPVALPAVLAGYREGFTALFGPPAVSSEGAWAWRTDAWTGATTLPLAPWRWPAGMGPPPPGQPLLLPRHRGPAFEAGPPPRR